MFTRRITEKRKKASSCFASILPPSPPPPPPTTVQSSMDALDANRQRFRTGTQSIYQASALSEEDEYLREIDETVASTQALIDQLGESNPILRRIMDGAITEMRASAAAVELSAAASATTTRSGYEASVASPSASATTNTGTITSTSTSTSTDTDTSTSTSTGGGYGTYGRRLMVRKFEYTESMSEALVDHPIMNQLTDGIPGVTIGVCEALCEAMNIDTDLENPSNCRAFAHKRANPFSLTYLSGRCFLLKNAGACKPADFGAALLTRQIQSEDICHDPQPGLADELCLQLPTTRYDTRILSHADAAEIAAQTPRNAPAGSGGLPRPRTALEAGFMIGLARQEGIYSFWAASPDSSDGDVTTHWYTEGGTPLVYKQGEFRCILVWSTSSSVATKMYATLESCE